MATSRVEKALSQASPPALASPRSVCLLIEQVHMEHRHGVPQDSPDRLSQPVQESRSTATSQLVMRVFVPSTFRDMHEEREELVKRFFPELYKRCEARGVTWTEVWACAGAYRHFTRYCATVPWSMHPRGCGGHWTKPHPRARRLAVRPACSPQAGAAGPAGRGGDWPPTSASRSETLWHTLAASPSLSTHT